MTEQINLALPDAIAQQAKDIATLTQQTLEDVLLQFVEEAIANFPIEIDRRVREAAHYRCGYCLSPQHLY